ncbi:hypothetical protein KIPB_012446, partial [Kipferlia bialata]
GLKYAAAGTLTSDVSIGVDAPDVKIGTTVDTDNLDLGSDTVALTVKGNGVTMTAAANLSVTSHSKSVLSHDGTSITLGNVSDATVISGDTISIEGSGAVLSADTDGDVQLDSAVGRTIEIGTDVAKEPLAITVGQTGMDNMSLVADAIALTGAVTSTGTVTIDGDTTVTGTVIAKFDASNKVTVDNGLVDITTAAATISSAVTKITGGSATIEDSTSASSVNVSTASGVVLKSNTAITADVTSGGAIDIGTDVVTQLVSVGNSDASTTVTLTSGVSSIAMTNSGITLTDTTIDSFSIAGNEMTGVTSATPATSALYIAAGASDADAIGGNLYLDGGEKHGTGVYGNVVIGGESTVLIDLQTDMSITGDVSFTSPAVISTSGDASGGDDLTLEAGSSTDNATISGHIVLKPGYLASSSVGNGQVQVHSDIEFDSSLDRTISVGSVSSGAGKDLTIAAGLSTDGAGGDVNIFGGDGNVDTVGATNNGAVNIGTQDTREVVIGTSNMDVTVTGDIVFNDDLEFNGSKTIKAGTGGGSTGYSLTLQGGDGTAGGDLILNGGSGNGLVNIGSTDTSSILLGSSVTTTSGSAFTIENDNIFTVNGNDLKLVGDN